MEDYLAEIQSDVAGIKSSIDSVGWFLLVLFIIILFSGVFDSKDKITDYSRSCEQANTTAQDCKSWNISKDTYYTNKYTQQVMFEGTYGPVPFENCHVVDNENWYCDSGIRQWGYKNGVVIDNPPPIFTTEHFGWFKYWWYKIIKQIL